MLPCADSLASHPLFGANLAGRRNSRCAPCSVRFVARRRARRDAVHRFLRELVERYNRQLDMLFSGVLNLIVTDAAKALDEHHDGGDSGARDFSSIVDGPGWQAVHRPAGFADCFVKKNGVYPKEAFPSNVNIAFRGKASARIFCIPQHSQKGFIGEMALIKGDAAFLDDAGRYARGRRAGADGAHASVAIRYAINLGTHC